jgi:hypothetical protein
MNFIVFNIILSFVLSSSNCVNTLAVKKWMDYKSKYYKNYKNKSGIDAYRLDIWKTKYEIIKEHNKKFEKDYETYTLGDNYFMDYVDFLKFYPFLINTNSYLLRRMNTKLKKKDLVLIQIYDFLINIKNSS